MINSIKAELAEWIVGFFAIIILLAIIMPFIVLTRVNYSEYGIKKTWTGHLNDNVLTDGIRYRGFGSIITASNQVRNYEIKVDAPSRDFQSVIMDLNLNLRLKKEQTYNFIKNYADENTYISYLNNKIQEKVKTIILKYDAEEILLNRINVSKELYNEVKDIPELTYFEFNDLTLANIEFKPEFDALLEKKAQILFEREILTQQKQNLVLLSENMKVVDINTYFKYKLIEKWDGVASLIISDAIINPANKGGI
jgi:regulator of protease activity HflC (stomatin/prohibitin superfamily)